MIGDTRRTVPERRTMVDCKAVSAVKRCLFGEPNHVQVQNELVKQLTMIIQQDSEKYNFDFVNGEPLKGKFQWEKLEKTEDNPKMVNSEVPDALERLQLTKSETSATEKNRKPTCLTKAKATRFRSKPQGKQLKLTGIFPQKKRSGLANDPVKSLKRHPSDSAILGSTVATKRSCRQRT